MCSFFFFCWWYLADLLLSIFRFPSSYYTCSDNILHVINHTVNGVHQNTQKQHVTNTTNTCDCVLLLKGKNIDKVQKCRLLIILPPGHFIALQQYMVPNSMNTSSEQAYAALTRTLYVTYRYLQKANNACLWLTKISFCWYIACLFLLHTLFLIASSLSFSNCRYVHLLS